MNAIYDTKKEIDKGGFSIVDAVFTNEEIDEILSIISQATSSNANFRKTGDLFAIRQFLKEVPALVPLVFSEKLNGLIANLFGSEYFVVKSIYFDKPESSNWFVSYHQDLTISVDRKVSLEGFGPWTTKQDQFAVQPPLSILQDNFTIRIHLDDTNENNGALKIITGSHHKGVANVQTMSLKRETGEICSVKKGGVMFMKPLLLHSSSRTINNKRRRVIHIEFSRSSLPDVLKWSELIPASQK